jgi:2-dehydropantoate 2-reductase
MNDLTPLPSNPTVAVVGAGAVGCYYGGLLARAGFAVTLIGRRAAVDLINERGLRIETDAFDESFKVLASDIIAAAADADIVLVCVKSSDTESVAQSLEPHLRPNTLVLSLQNGVSNAAALLAQLACPIVPAGVYVATSLGGPGHVRHHGGGALVIGSPRERPVSPEQLQSLVALFARAQVPVTISQELEKVQWTKLVVNCAYNALSAITMNPYSSLVASPLVHTVMSQVIDEANAVALACGVDLGPDLKERVFQVATLMPGQRSSTAQDVARKRPTEIDHLNGHIVREGGRLGIATPVNRTLHALVRQIEASYA